MRSHIILCAAVLSLFALADTLSAQSQSLISTTYTLRFLHGNAAGVLAFEQCPDELQRYCRVISSGPRFLTFLAPVEVHTQVARLLSERDSTPDTQTVQLILLVARREGPSDAGLIGTAAQRALDDIQQYVPYKSYTLLGTALIRTTGKASSRVAGPDGRAYEAALQVERLGDDAGKLYVQQFELKELQERRAHPSEGKDDATPVLSTSFALDVGETVVVGTPKLSDGDQTLVVLMTALP